MEDAHRVALPVADEDAAHDPLYDPAVAPRPLRYVHELNARNLKAPRPGDVLLGRGKSHCLHPGNARFKNIIRQLAPRFDATPIQERDAVIHEAISIVEEQHGRFLRVPDDGQSKGVGGWALVDPVTVRIKVGQAFRYRNRQTKRGATGSATAVHPHVDRRRQRQPDHARRQRLATLPAPLLLLPQHPAHKLPPLSLPQLLATRPRQLDANLSPAFAQPLALLQGPFAILNIQPLILSQGILTAHGDFLAQMIGNSATQTQQSSQDQFFQVPPIMQQQPTLATTATTPKAGHPTAPRAPNHDDDDDDDEFDRAVQSMFPPLPLPPNVNAAVSTQPTPVPLTSQDWWAALSDDEGGDRKPAARR